VRGVRLSRNFGAHAALYCGLSLCRGAVAATLAADMQDPPQVISDMLDRWREGAQVIWAKRIQRLGDAAGKKVLASSITASQHGLPTSAVRRRFRRSTGG
jgi:dolichol-phosphate mannosyltransferase